MGGQGLPGARPLGVVPTGDLDVRGRRVNALCWRGAGMITPTIAVAVDTASLTGTPAPMTAPRVGRRPVTGCISLTGDGRQVVVG